MRFTDLSILYIVGFCSHFTSSSTAPGDYVPFQLVLTFTGTLLRQCITVTIINDTIDEQQLEFFTVQLTQLETSFPQLLEVDVFIVDDGMCVTSSCLLLFM